jgi:hypothetical protein
MGRNFMDFPDLKEEQ